MAAQQHSCMVLAAVTNEVCDLALCLWADHHRVRFVDDEAHAVMISPEAEREIADFIRDGRKHHAAVLLGSHDPLADFGSPTMRQLIPTRILMRHRDKDLAANSLKWLGLDPTDQDLLDLVCTNMSPVSPGEGVPPHRRGECLIRDTSGNVGRGKVLVPSVRERGLAVMTSGPTGGSPIAEASSCCLLYTS